ncbi:pentatricopeptide repeat-containing protein [Tripterygium wilfordii]|uniref:Pentatricopeptide repeat-containing protein n=1 Tax=Tripterygium wilfordii TaxID=458696 RepID=A0A7J7D3A0_TRIWF|nr:pentatricopeptide repeat-containing protein [Tripterygium wilfordii]
MENLTIPCISKLPLPIPARQDTIPESTTRKSRISSPRKLDVRYADKHLNYLCRGGRLAEAITALDSIAQHGSPVTPNTFINLLQSCIDTNSIHLGRKIHAYIDLVKERDPFVDTKLVGMYAKCGSLDDARKVFDETRDRNLFMWSAIIGACSRKHRWEEVVELFYKMMGDGFVPDSFLMPKILQACGNCEDFETGRLIHSLAVRCGLGCNVHVNNSILAGYAKCGRMGFARKVFERMDERDRVAWNSMISGYCQKGESEESRRLFDAMREDGFEPGLVTWNIMIASYNQLGRCDVALELMRKMESCGVRPDVFSWTSMISGYAKNNRRNQALDLFREMLIAGVQPNGVTITSAVSACASLKALDKGLEIHSVAIKVGCFKDVPVGNAILDMYSKCGEMEAARQVFDSITDKDSYSWNSIIGGYCQAGYCGKAYELFMKMQKSEVKPNVITWNVIISGYIQNGDEEQAMDLFQRMKTDGKIKQNTASWNALIAGYVHIGQKNKALGMFRKMQSACVSPNSVTVLSVLPACADLVAARKVKEIHGCVFRRGLESVLPVANALIDSYAKSGNISYPRYIFDLVALKDIITWNSMIAAYVLHGRSTTALSLYDQMIKVGLNPNRGSFTSIIIAYSLAGKVDAGKQIFSSITEDYQIVPALEHYLAMISLYGRSGKLREAMEFIHNMPMEPNSSIWTALLTACRSHKNFVLAIHALECLLELEPGNTLIHHLIRQTYERCGRFEDALNVTKLEKVNLVQSLIGQSRIEVKNVVHTFVTGDQSKPYLDHLYSWVKKIAREVDVIDSRGGVCIEEEEKEEIGGVHSEKLALSFALIGSPSTSQTIRIMKNVRMCGDCHRMAKYVSMKYGCEIYLSDSTCLHHFKNGHCSCRDYW